jgi:DNA-binding response OmpR family regulator
MRRNTVVVANDDMVSTGEVLQWLETQAVHACGISDRQAVDTVRELKPRVVICGDGPDGIALCHALRELPEPPMVVVLSQDPTVQDDVYFDGLTMIAIVRAPVHMAALSLFITTAMQIATRLDHKDAAAVASQGLLLHAAAEPRVLH